MRYLKNLLISLLIASKVMNDCRISHFDNRERNFIRRVDEGEILKRLEIVFELKGEQFFLSLKSQQNGLACGGTGFDSTVFW